MREKQKKIMQWSSLALILLTGIIVWRVNYEIDFMMDDEWYSTLLYADTPIRNLGDIVHAQIWHYFNWGGRSMAHALLQMILLTGESWADILNTAMTFILAWLICQAAGFRAARISGIKKCQATGFHPGLSTIFYNSTTRSFTCVKLPPSIFLRTKGTPLRT